jgi:hypothetical protein
MAGPQLNIQTAEIHAIWLKKASQATAWYLIEGKIRVRLQKNTSITLTMLFQPFHRVKPTWDIHNSSPKAIAPAFHGPAGPKTV